MRNIDWLCENDREALAKIIAEGDECEYCAFEIEDDCGIRCCEGVRKWLEAEHNDGSAPVLEPDSSQLEPDTSGKPKVDACGRISAEDFAKAISDGMKKVNAAIESHGKTHDFYAFDELDTREKLEADVMNYYTHTVSTALWPDSANKKTKYVNVSMDQVLGWLDRQAAITRQGTLLEIHSTPFVGLVRGRQWERKESSDYYCGKCGWKVTDHYSYCPECGGALHRAPNQPTSQSDAPKAAKTAENDASKYEIRDFDDSRKKLEADIHEFKLRHAQDKLELIAFESISCRWLDRQAAIIERECEEREEELRRRFWKRVEEDDLDIARLTAERDWLVREVNGLMKNQPYAYDPETPIASLKTLGRYIGEQSEKLDAALRKLDDEKRMTAFLRRQSRG